MAICACFFSSSQIHKPTSHRLSMNCLQKNMSGHDDTKEYKKDRVFPIIDGKKLITVLALFKYTDAFYFDIDCLPLLLLCSSHYLPSLLGVFAQALFSLPICFVQTGFIFYYFIQEYSLQQHFYFIFFNFCYFLSCFVLAFVNIFLISYDVVLTSDNLFFQSLLLNMREKYSFLFPKIFLFFFSLACSLPLSLSIYLYLQ